MQVGIIAAFIALWRRKPRWDQDHVDTDENLPTIYWDPEDPKLGEINIMGMTLLNSISISCNQKRQKVLKKLRNVKVR